MLHRARIRLLAEVLVSTQIQRRDVCVLARLAHPAMRDGRLFGGGGGEGVGQFVGVPSLPINCRCMGGGSGGEVFLLSATLVASL